MGQKESGVRLVRRRNIWEMNGTPTARDVPGRFRAAWSIVSEMFPSNPLF